MKKCETGSSNMYVRIRSNQKNLNFKLFCILNFNFNQNSKENLGKFGELQTSKKFEIVLLDIAKHYGYNFFHRNVDACILLKHEKNSYKSEECPIFFH